MRGVRDSFVNHFDGHFAYLKTLNFSFKTKGQFLLDEIKGFRVSFHCASRSLKHTNPQVPGCWPLPSPFACVCV